MNARVATVSSARTLARRAYQRLRLDIVHGQLAAGSKLKLEALVQQYEIGMSPLREALARLVGDQLVKTEDQRGFWVAPLSLDELDDISRVRNLIETEALRLSIVHGDDAWERGVREAFQALSDVELGLPQMQQPLPQETLNLWEECNHQFHTALIAACRSPWLIKLQELLYHQAERYRRVSLNHSLGRRFVHDEHVAIYEAAMARNALRACRLTEDHLMSTFHAVRSTMARLQVESAEAGSA
ncbi:transcriptional regulator [Pseudoxanthomonas broegbernensis]|uniref:Transcriptional regulator n=1 Tax=Pseudoxanthomonas broegbernensis TaxID=83619 RepID=A0A7V8GKH6_9GAMM|nr:FCD domain-containing protein [Pseudoxanthomonas broegbernensis]KAF1685084.1 transcriptional regulator [Pseudoxanthomonas broegbernensis]MBB6066254.1 DNA-binding GntR family transcriptional regulator [Pseudoxanthomonas broegbernensis]